MYKFYFVLGVLFLLSCETNTSKIDDIYKDRIQPNETGQNIKMIYSDSANVLFVLESPKFIIRKIENEKTIDYPDGIKITFLDKQGTAKSWLTADKAINKVKKKRFIAKENVKLFNLENDKLESSELIWDEKLETLSTEKFVKITQPSKGDTLYGYGFVSNKEFTEFEIKHRLFGKIVEDIFQDIK